jgi:hypothetical protein
MFREQRDGARGFSFGSRDIFAAAGGLAVARCLSTAQEHLQLFHEYRSVLEYLALVPQSELSKKMSAFVLLIGNWWVTHYHYCSDL